MCNRLFVFLCICMSGIVGGGCEFKKAPFKEVGKLEIQILYQYSQALEDELVEYYVNDDSIQLEDVSGWSNDISPRRFCAQSAFESDPSLHEDQEERDCEGYRERQQVYHQCLRRVRRVIQRQVRHCFDACSNQVESRVRSCLETGTREECVGLGRDTLEECYDIMCSDFPLPSRDRDRLSFLEDLNKEERVLIEGDHCEHSTHNHSVNRPENTSDNHADHRSENQRKQHQQDQSHHR